MCNHAQQGRLCTGTCYTGIYRMLGTDDLCMILSTNAHAVGVMCHCLQGLLGSMLTDDALDLGS